MEFNITSKSNEKVKYIKSLNEKKFRQKYKAFYLEGIKVVNEAIDNKAVNIQFIAYSESMLVKNNGGSDLIEKINFNKIEKILLSDEVFKYVTDTITPQGVLAVIDKVERNLDMIDKNSDVLILDKVQDLGNIGTIIRSADAFGIKNIVAIDGTGDIYAPKVIRATMGSILRENILYVKEEEIEKLFLFLKENSFKVIGTSLDTSNFLESLIKNQKYAFIVGNEANGISNKILNMCDELVKINMYDTAESLNVGVATGIVLYEIFKKNN